MDYDRIITHGDFDGVVSGAICSFVLGVDTFIFTGPSAITRAEISIGTRDVVCDLPYPLECGLWFDHHPGNCEALALRGIDPAGIPGRLDGTKPSAARVVFEYFSERGANLPARFAETVAEADTIDSFDYRTVDEWLRETPGKLVDMSLKAQFPSPRERTKFLDLLVRLVRDGSLADVLRDAVVAGCVARYRDEEKRMIEFLKNRSASWTRTSIASSSFSISPRTRGRPACSRSRVPSRAGSARGPDLARFVRRIERHRHIHLDVPLHEHD